MKVQVDSKLNSIVLDVSKFLTGQEYLYDILLKTIKEELDRLTWALTNNTALLTRTYTDDYDTEITRSLSVVNDILLDHKATEFVSGFHTNYHNLLDNKYSLLDTLKRDRMLYNVYLDLKKLVKSHQSDLDKNNNLRSSVCKPTPSN